MENSPVPISITLFLPNFPMIGIYVLYPILVYSILGEVYNVR